MKSTILSFLLLAAAGFSASATTISQWTFEVNTPASLNNSTTSPSVGADVGSGTASGLHASAATDWSTPDGNGSANSFSANSWAAGDYFQFSLSAAGYADIKISFDQTSSGTGPGRFNFDYSTDGSSFATFAANYTVLPNATPNTPWNSTARDSLYTFEFDLSSLTSLDNAQKVYFRFVDISTTSANGGTVAGGGTSRIDNFTVSGTELANVPDSSPGWLGFGAVAAVVVLGWRRSEPKSI